MKPAHSACVGRIQVGTFVDPARDVGGWDSSHLAAANPPGWSVGVGYAVLANSTDSLPVKAGGDVTEAAWHNVVDLPELAFDHLLILRTALRCMCLCVWRCGGGRRWLGQGTPPLGAEAAGPWGCTCRMQRVLLHCSFRRQLAEQQGPQQGADLAGRLRKAADVLEGPWQHHPDR